jgi:hypothetical protein
MASGFSAVYFLCQSVEMLPNTFLLYMGVNTSYEEKIAGDGFPAVVARLPSVVVRQSECWLHQIRHG